jgi:hypothetical protein
MADGRFTVNRPEDLGVVPKLTGELEINGRGWRGWDQRPLAEADIEALSAMCFLEKLTLTGFDISPVPLLEIIHPDVLTVLEIRSTRHPDQALLESLPRFSYITDLALDLGACAASRFPRPLRADPLRALTYLRSLKLKADFSQAAGFLTDLRELPLKSLELTTDRLQPDCLEAIKSFSALTSLAVYASRVAVRDFSPLGGLRRLRTFIMFCGPTLPYPAVLEFLRVLGMVHMKESRGCIGE